MSILLYAIPIVSEILYTMLTKSGDFSVFLANVVLSVFTAGIYYTFLHIREDYFYQKINHKLLFWMAYVLSFLFLGISEKIPVGCIWLIAIVIVALDCGLELALPNYLYFMIQYAIIILSDDKDIYRFLLYVLIGLVVALLFSQVKEKKVIPYLAVILISSDVALWFAIHQFNISKMKAFAVEGIVEIISMLLLVLVAFSYLQAVSQKEEKRKQQLMRFMEPDFELLVRMEEYSMSLMAHSMRISQLSEGAALAVGADALLVKAGGLFHEIGRITDEKNYIEASMELGRKRNFPEDLLAVMRQHSTGYEMPKTIEAAIVMLSDCIVSTSEYLVQTGKSEKISHEKLVQSVFQNRIQKGNLKESGISDKQIEILRNYYIQTSGG